MIVSIINLPNELLHFWNAGAGFKIQILFFLFLLYLLGYYSSKLMQNRNWWKWLLLIFLAWPFLIQVYFSKQILIIFPVLLGMFKGLVLGNAGLNPIGAFEGIADFILSVQYRRGHAQLRQKYEEAEEVLRQAHGYADSQKSNHQSSNRDADYEKEQFREEMKRQRAKQEDAQEQEQDESKSSFEDEMRWQKGHRAKPDKDASEPPPQRKESQDSKPDSEAEPDNRTPQEILGLDANFTQAELKKARNEALKRCHSDKWADKPKTFQRAMEEETKKINWAYERLKK